MTKESLGKFLENCVNAEIGNDALLIVDSWTSFKSHDYIQEHLGSEHEVTIMNIPPKCTPICQPLDVYFNRMWKSYARNVTEHAILHCTEDVLSKRDNVIKLHSLIHEQFMAPRFKTFIQYAWHAAGYTPNHPGEHYTPNGFCFDFESTAKCSTTNCSQSVLLRCAHCLKNLCFTCFFTNCHSHL